ncbi:hypothetical protein V500_05174 [Pseudogymnoascus sp. VKM F-4518 (FW-2643)]|nr:hypothetical protein V500_05174 [Pseudogymnoascus sp. VKM F-4518 (FW-2643)]
MVEVLSPSSSRDARDHESSSRGAAMAAPPSPSRQSLTFVNASPSPKKLSHRTKRRFFDNISHRMKYALVSVVDGADVARSYIPRQQHSVDHGLNDLRYFKTVLSRGATTSHYPFGACQGSKSPLSAYPTTRPGTTPQPALKLSQLGHLSATKTLELVPNTLLASRSSKDLQLIATDLPHKITEENVTGPHLHKKNRDSLSHDSAIPIPFGDVLLRSPSPQSATAGQGLCGKGDGSVLEGLIGVQEKDIKPLCPWDEADSKILDVDDKNLPSKDPGIITSTMLESVLESPKTIPTEIKSVIGKAHSDDNSDDDESNSSDSGVSSPEGSSALECNGYKHRGSQTTTQALSDTPESGVNWSTGSESFRASGYGDAPSFEGLSPS